MALSKVTFMGWIIFILVNTLVGAAIWYFACGLEEQDKQDDKKGNTGCILALVLGFIGALLVAGMVAIGK